MDIRRAVPADAAALTEITFAAKRYWGYPEEWIQSWSELLRITPEYIEQSQVYVAVDGEILGYYALLATGESCRLDNLWIRPARIRGGIGRRLWTHACSTAVKLGAKWLELEADPNAVGFYERMGARRVGGREGDYGRVLPIMRFDLVPGAE